MKHLPSNTVNWVSALALVLLTGAIYWSVQTHGFISFDDSDYVSANPRVQAGLTTETIRWAFTEAYACNWHPITWLAHALDCQLFGLKPGAHHLMQLAWHVINTLLLLILLARLTGKWWRAWLVAALFAIHPTHVESVAWVAERKDVLSAFFGILTLLAYTQYVQSVNHPLPNKSKWIWYGAALLAYALGLMSKPMLVTWPAIMLLLDVWPLRRLNIENLTTIRKQLAKLTLEKIPLLALAITSSVITMIAQRGGGATVPWEVLPLSDRLANIPVAYLTYLGKTFWPTNLGVFYPYQIVTADSVSLWLSLAALILVTLWVCRQRVTQPFLAVGWFWFLGTLVPVIGLVQVGLQSVADRYTYLPSIGLFIGMIWLVADWLERKKTSALWGGLLTLSIILPCAGLTLRQVSYWENTTKLARHTVEVTQNNYLAMTQVASTLVESNQLDAALAQLSKALAINPHYAEAENLLAQIYLRQGKTAEARSALEAAVRSDHTFAEPLCGLADLCLKDGAFAEAEAHAQAALAISPLHLRAQFLLAQALQNQNKLDAAAQAYQRLSQLAPKLYTAHRGLGSVYMLQGKISDAIQEFESALKIQPEAIDSHLTLGAAHYTQGDFTNATQHFTYVINKEPTNALANYNLALILNAQGQLATAAKYYQNALAAQPAWPEALNNFAWLLATSSDPAVRNGAQAVAAAQQACALTSNQEPLFLGTLAAAYAESGLFDKATETAHKAITLAEKNGLAIVAKRNLELLEYYQANRPYHEPTSP